MGFGTNFFGGALASLGENLGELNKFSQAKELLGLKNKDALELKSADDELEIVKAIMGQLGGKHGENFMNRLGPLKAYLKDKFSVDLAALGGNTGVPRNRRNPDNAQLTMQSKKKTLLVPPPVRQKTYDID